MTSPEAAPSQDVPEEPTTVVMKITRRIRRFVTVGTFATLTDWSLLFIATHFLGWSAALVNPFSYAMGSCVNYFGSRNFTFAEASEQAMVGQAGRYGLVQGLGWTCDQLLVAASRYLAPMAGISAMNAHWPGKTVSLILVSALTFTLHRRWTFKAE